MKNLDIVSVAAAAEQDDYVFADTGHHRGVYHDLYLHLPGLHKRRGVYHDHHRHRHRRRRRHHHHHHHYRHRHRHRHRHRRRRRRRRNCQHYDMCHHLEHRQSKIT